MSDCFGSRTSGLHKRMVIWDGSAISARPDPGSVPNGHDGDRTGDVFGEVFQVAGVTCVYVIAATSGGLDDDGINDVGGSGAAA